MSSKKSKGKTKKVSQNDLRKMMNDMKNKRTVDSGNAGRKVLNNPNAYKKALSDQKKLQALISGTKVEETRKSESRIEKSKYDISQKLESDKSLKRELPDKNYSANSENGRESKIPKTDTATVDVQRPSGLVTGDYGSDSDDDEKNTENTKEEGGSNGQEAKPEEPKEVAAESSSLPEGFFDDPEVDAKVRGVETPADAMDREWEEFQKEIQRETGQSEQIVEEEEELDKVDREIEEIDEQIMHFSRVEKLNNVRKGKKQNLKLEKKPKQDSSESDDDSDEDVNEFLDWREKDSHL